MISGTISRYRILEKLSTQVTGDTYQAEDTQLRRTVGLKILPAGVVAEPERVSRILHELQKASAVEHPNIARVYEAGQTDGVAFVVTEPMEGQTLEVKISGRPLGLSEVIDFGIQLAGAVSVAHTGGVIHGHIRSDNIMITRRVELKLLDFGLAEIVLPAVTDAGVESKSDLAIAALQYMSPEQVLGQIVDYRTDIFSVGVVLYEMVTGRRPFLGRNIEEVKKAILAVQPPSMFRHDVDMPTELLRIVGRCLQNNPDRRYQTAGDLVTDLEGVKPILKFF